MIKKLALATIALGLMGLASRSAAAGEQIVSKYTSTARANSISFKDHSDVPEGGFEALFPGHGGYQLLLLSGDERSWINIRYGKTTVDLYAATMKKGARRFSPQGKRRGGMAGRGEGWPVHALRDHLSPGCS